MKRLLFLFVAFLSFSSHSFAATTDAYWNSISVELQTQTDRSPMEEILNREAPGLLTAIQSDATNTFYHDQWGKCINFDQLAKGIIVAPNILDFLVSEFQAPARDGLYMFAGLQHTYGYLFSTLQTAFGFKRARWITPDIENGLSLPLGELGPFPTQGTLFTNVSYLAGHVAFREQPERIRAIEAAGPAVTASVRLLNYSGLNIRRMVETFDNFPNVVLHTDLVAFPNMPSDPTANTYLLVYSVNNLLVTAFPVNTATVTGIFAPNTLGAHQAVATQYNAYVPGISDAPAGTIFYGTRQEQ